MANPLARLVPFTVDGPIQATSMLDGYRASLNGPGRPLSQLYLAEERGIDRRKVQQIALNSEKGATGHSQIALYQKNHRSAEICQSRIVSRRTVHLGFYS